MAKTTVTKALTGYFNQPGDTDSLASNGGKNVPATVQGVSAKRPAKEWLQELKALSDDEKLILANGVVAITGDELA